MWIIKCDICKRQIKDDSIKVGLGFSKRLELCQKCGAPILQFLKKSKVIEAKEESKLYGI